MIQGKDVSLVMVRVIDEPKLSQEMGARCLKESPNIPSTEGTHFNLSCVARRDHQSESHVAFTLSDKGVITWIEWSDNE